MSRVALLSIAPPELAAFAVGNASGLLRRRLSPRSNDSSAGMAHGLADRQALAALAASNMRSDLILNMAYELSSAGSVYRRSSTIGLRAPSPPPAPREAINAFGNANT